MFHRVVAVPEDIDYFEAPNLDEPTSSIHFTDPGDQSLRTAVPFRLRPSDYHEGYIQTLAGQIPKVRVGPTLSISCNGSSGKRFYVSLADQTCATLSRLCRSLVGYKDIQIYYWDPLYRTWTEARACGSLDLMMKDVKDKKVVHVFVLRPWEKAADLPDVRVDEWVDWGVVPVRGRREPCVKPERWIG
ncbi:hypothetical protein ONS95_007595 [Cadophora gregata]|uniref:uncharacterized protein n=1 Tax=Cadophora gregata TaxID=51156 RepID=UPI0026DAAC36|nr:uncharacterized protein ONS95_007595 [Cadophora gregata]KAK0118709.1 hypothetical protein ONS96_011797 [Cadophora gregata f. sp. sojae]KAK0125972.1 hypothetical protein ONS95_007595 [Cadophora gregata]